MEWKQQGRQYKSTSSACTLILEFQLIQYQLNKKRKKMTAPYKKFKK